MAKHFCFLWFSGKPATVNHFHNNNVLFCCQYDFVNSLMQRKFLARRKFWTFLLLYTISCVGFVVGN